MVVLTGRRSTATCCKLLQCRTAHLPQSAQVPVAVCAGGAHHGGQGAEHQRGAAPRGAQPPELRRAPQAHRRAALKCGQLPSQTTMLRRCCSAFDAHKIQLLLLGGCTLSSRVSQECDPCQCAGPPLAEGHPPQTVRPALTAESLSEILGYVFSESPVLVLPSSTVRP